MVRSNGDVGEAEGMMDVIPVSQSLENDESKQDNHAQQRAANRSFKNSEHKQKVVKSQAVASTTANSKKLRTVKTHTDTTA